MLFRSIFIDFDLFKENLELFLNQFQQIQNSCMLQLNGTTGQYEIPYGYYDKTAQLNIFLTIDHHSIDGIKIKEVVNISDSLDMKIIVKPVIKSHLVHLLNQCHNESLNHKE